MKKTLFFGTTIAILSAPVMATTQCVYKPSESSQNCTASTLGETDWSITCDGQTYRGVAMLSYDTDETYDVLPNSGYNWGKTSELSNKKLSVTCYCKMIYPVESKWVKRDSTLIAVGNIAGDWADGLSQIDTCAFYCLDDMAIGDSSSYAVSVNKYLSNLKD